MRARRLVWFAAAAPVLAGACRTPQRGPTAIESAQAIAAALQTGQLELAVAAAARARVRHSDSGYVAEWSGAVADLLWQDDQAIRELRAASRAQDLPAERRSELRGRLGELLFRSGQYGAAVDELLASPGREPQQRRMAFAAIARQLPFVRKEAGPLATEQPLLGGAVPEFVCGVGRRRRPFAIDTGTSMTTLSRGFAVEVGVRSMRAAGEAYDGAGRPLEVEVGVLDDFAVGDVEVGAIPVLVVPDEALSLRDFHGGPERQPAGVLGLDLLASFRITLDPERASVALELPRGLAEGEGVQCVRADGRCLVPVAVEGQRLWFVLDTGASHSSLSQEGLQSLPGGDSRAAPAFRRVRTSGGGTLAVREVRDLVLRVSQARFAGVALPVVSRQGVATFPVHGVIGMDLIGLCRVTLDRGRARLEAVK